MIGSPNEDNRTNRKRTEAAGLRVQSIERNASFPTTPPIAVTKFSKLRCLKRWLSPTST
jgi:hypothetical protein